MATCSGSGAFQGGVPGGQGIPPFQQEGGFAQRNKPSHSNVVKKYANWNMCHLCGFDVEDGHTSATCSGHWCKPKYDEAFTCANMQQYINQGYDVCMKGMQKTTFPAAGF
jgi:hypothetical protein